MRLPASSYKGSFDWMLRRFKGGDVARRFVEQQLLPNETKLGGFLSTLGPHVRSLASALQQNGVQRYPKRGSPDLYRSMPHLGPGAAVHLSSVTDPLRMWLRASRASVNEGGVQGAVPGEVLLAAIHRNASPAVISRNIKPWCRSSEGHGANVGVRLLKCAAFFGIYENMGVNSGQSA